MIKDYDELTPDEHNKLSKAWLLIVQGLDVYQEITGADQLDDMVHSFIWDTVTFEKAGILHEN